MHRRQQILLRLNTKVLVQDAQRVCGSVIQRGTTHQPLVGKGVTDILADCRGIEGGVQWRIVPDRRRLVGTALIDGKGRGVIQQAAAVLGNLQALALAYGEAPVQIGRAHV